ncbi:MAG TPA: hypothetical protein VJ725_20800 [Thermoanaerobaculia bacterium]|nr:hypothetical protein [Thermoanaerobaculia bacterium]
MTQLPLFPHGVFHAENVGGQSDEVLDKKVWLGCFPSASRAARRPSRGSWRSWRSAETPREGIRPWASPGGLKRYCGQSAVEQRLWVQQTCCQSQQVRSWRE